MQPTDDVMGLTSRRNNKHIARRSLKNTTQEARSSRRPSPSYIAHAAPAEYNK